MDYIKDITLGEFANLSYIDLPEDFNKDLKKDIEIPLSDFADSCIGYYLDKEKSGEISCQEQDILNTLRQDQVLVLKSF